MRGFEVAFDYMSVPFFHTIVALETERFRLTVLFRWTIYYLQLVMTILDEILQV